MRDCSSGPVAAELAVSLCARGYLLIAAGSSSGCSIRSMHPPDTMGARSAHSSAQSPQAIAYDTCEGKRGIKEERHLLYRHVSTFHMSLSDEVAALALAQYRLAHGLVLSTDQ